MAWIALGEYHGARQSKALMRYIAARINEANDERLWREYMAELLAGAYGANVRLSELRNPPQDYEAEDIIEQVTANAGLEVIE